ncbi:hypothetical protein EBR57_03500 [bacterium]|nr:hypothetical protein [bacterium]
MKRRLFSIVAGALFIGFALLIPMISIPKLGISWDEPFQRHYGDVITRWITEQDPQLYQDSERYYGPLVPTLLYIPEAMGWTTDPIAIYEIRHWINWAIFLTAIPFTFLLSRRAGLPRHWSLVSAAVLMTTPVIAGHGLFNSKDIPFLTICLTSTWLWCWYLDNMSLKRALILGIGFGIALLSRINAMNVIALLLLVGITIRRPSLRELSTLIATTLGTTIVCYVGWPTLWHNPWVEFKTAVITMANYPWSGYVLFNGELISAQHLPWTYIPVWIGITLNPIAIAIFISSCLYGLYTIPRWIRTPNLALSLVGAISVIPIGIGILTEITFYDSWRHLFFVYPGLLILSVYGLSRIISLIPKGGVLGLGIGIIYAITTAITWATYFPYVHCYLNSFAGPRESIIYNWEMDYWGVSYRELLTQIPAAAILPENLPASANIELVPLPKRSQFTVVNTPDSATLFITNHRLRRGPLPYPKAGEISRDGFPLATAYRLKP